jgi:MFS family permease
MYTLGGLIGALSAGPVASRFGRLRTMQITTIFFTIGPIFEALSPNIGVMAFGRLLSGVGAGAAVVIVPLYISEISPPAQKGFFGAFTQIMCNVGILVTQLLGYFLSHDSYWRFILAAGGLIGIAQALGLLLSVESPKYIAEQGNIALAKKTLRRIRGEDADIDSEMSDWGTAGYENVNGQYILDPDMHWVSVLIVVQRKSKPS